MPLDDELFKELSRVSASTGDNEEERRKREYLEKELNRVLASQNMQELQRFHDRYFEILMWDQKERVLKGIEDRNIKEQQSLKYRANLEIESQRNRDELEHQNRKQKAWHDWSMEYNRLKNGTTFEFSIYWSEYGERIYFGIIGGDRAILAGMEFTCRLSRTTNPNDGTTIVLRYPDNMSIVTHYRDKPGFDGRGPTMQFFITSITAPVLNRTIECKNYPRQVSLDFCCRESQEKICYNNLFPYEGPQPS